MSKNNFYINLLILVSLQSFIYKAFLFINFHKINEKENHIVFRYIF